MWARRRRRCGACRSPAASADGVGALDVRAAQALGLGRLADADDLRVAGLLGAGGAERVERGLRRVGQLVAVGEQHRRAQRPAHELRGGDRRAPVLAVDERDRGRAGVARARGVDRLRDARGVGDRVGAAHARRVLRGEAGEAEALRRLLVVAALPDHGLARLVGGVLAAPAAAGGEGERGRAARRSARTGTSGDTLAVVQVGVRHSSRDAPARQKLFKSATEKRRSPVGHNAARGYTVPRQNAESPGHAGERGTQLCGASQRPERREARALSAPARQLTP